MLQLDLIHDEQEEAAAAAAIGFMASTAMFVGGGRPGSMVVDAELVDDLAPVEVAVAATRRAEEHGSLVDAH